MKNSKMRKSDIRKRKRRRLRGNLMMKILNSFKTTLEYKSSKERDCKSILRRKETWMMVRINNWRMKTLEKISKRSILTQLNKEGRICSKDTDHICLMKLSKMKRTKYSQILINWLKRCYKSNKERRIRILTSMEMKLMISLQQSKIRWLRKMISQKDTRLKLESKILLLI